MVLIKTRVPPELSCIGKRCSLSCKNENKALLTAQGAVSCLGVGECIPLPFAGKKSFLCLQILHELSGYVFFFPSTDEEKGCGTTTDVRHSLSKYLALSETATDA